MSIAPGDRIGPYEVVSLLGRGGMGEVFLANDTRLHRKVVLKTVREADSQGVESRHRMLHEARAAATLNHPNIAAIYDVLERDDQMIIVMEYVSGATLNARLQQGRLPPAAVIDIGVQLLEALVEAHAHGIVHRDLKPANVCLMSNGTVKVLDFGIARIRTPDPLGDATETSGGLPTISPPGRVVGTPGYSPPEQLMGPGVDDRSDIYSLGVLLFELCTGRLPFDGSDALALAMASVRAPALVAHELEPTVPVELSAIIGRAMKREPSARYQSAETMRAGLRRLHVPASERRTEQFPTIELPTDAPPPVQTVPIRVARRRTVLAATAVAMIAAVGWLATRPEPPPLFSRTVTIAPIVGVLPFTNAGDDAADDHLGVGMADLLISALDRMPAVSVVSGSATLGGQAGNVDLQAVASSLGATALVRGSFSREDDRLDVSASLVAADGRVAWEEDYDIIFNQYAEMQRDLVEGISAGLGIEPTAADRARLTRAPTESLEAFSAYAQGRLFLERQDRPRDDIAVAIGFFERAVGTDAGFALAHAGLGDAYWAQFQETREPAWAVSATDAVLEALELDPDLPQVRLSLATIYQGTGRSELSEDQVRRVIEEQPSNSDAHRMLGQTLAVQGRLDEALEEHQQAIDLRPNYWRHHGDLGLLYFQVGRRPLAAAAFRRVTELMPASARGFQMLGAVYQTLGEVAQARENYERALQLGELPATYTNLGLLHYADQNYPAATEAFERARDLSPNDFRFRRNLGDAYRELGRADDAHSEYERAVELVADLADVDPTNAMLQWQRAVLETLVGRFTEARRHVDEAARLAPEDGNIFYFKAVVHASADEPDEALAALGQALARGFPAALVRPQGELTSLEDRPEFGSMLEETPSQTTAPGQTPQIQQLRGLLDALDAVVQQHSRQ